MAQFEVHLGPRREFAIFTGVQDEHRDHDSPDNLLKPYRVTMEGTRAKQRWEIPSLNLAFTVTLGGGSRTDCESWYILLEPLERLPADRTVSRPGRKSRVRTSYGQLPEIDTVVILPTSGRHGPPVSWGA